MHIISIMVLANAKHFMAAFSFPSCFCRQFENIIACFFGFVNSFFRRRAAAFFRRRKCRGGKALAPVFALHLSAPRRVKRLNRRALPLLADHVLREANHYIRLLKG